MARSPSLYQRLVRGGFGFLSPGRYSVAEIREAVRKQYPELCDDTVESTRYGSEQDRGVPQWHHWLRDALKDSKGKWVERDASSKQGFWLVLDAGRVQEGDAEPARVTHGETHSGHARRAAEASIPDLSVITAEHVRRAIAEIAEVTTPSPFGPPTKYEVRWEGRSFAPNALVGFAYKHATGMLAPPSSFSGGEGFANAVLSKLGFRVQLIAGTGEDWTDEECKLLVADYFAMLNAELLGQPYSKTEHNKRLREIVHRSRGSVERKHMNVSAAMVELALPYIDGYKPNDNRQQRLMDAVEGYLQARPDFFERPEVSARIEPAATSLSISIASAEAFFEDPPDADIPQRPEQPWRSRRGRRVDYAVRDAANRAMGRRGEEFAVALERRRLTENGRDDLAGKVRHVAAEDGDGTGYDVLSFNHVTGAERWLEVKTTTLGKFHPFLVTSNEVACSEAEPDRFELFRVFGFGAAPRVFRLLGPLRDRCRLEPSLYRAGPPFTDWSP